MSSPEFQFSPEREAELEGPRIRSEMLDHADPSVEARKEFFELLFRASLAKNNEAPKIPEQERAPNQFNGIGFIDQIRPVKRMKPDKLFVCDFDDTIFDTTGFHEGIAKRCESLGVSHDEWFEVYERSKDVQENQEKHLYSRAKHIAELQKRHPEVADEIKQTFEDEPLGQYVDAEVVKALNVVAARSDSTVMILTHGELATQKFKLDKVPELTTFASSIAYTQVPKREFLEAYLSSDERPVSSKKPLKDDPSRRRIQPKVFLLDDNPSEVENFTEVGRDIHFQAMRLRLPRAKRAGKEQKADWWGTVLESAELPQGYTESEMIYRAFLSFTKGSQYIEPGGNNSLATLHRTDRVSEKGAASEKYMINRYVFGSTQEAEKLCSKLTNEEYACWPANYQYHGGPYGNGGTISESCKVFRFDSKNNILEEDSDILAVDRGWKKANLDELLDDDRYIF